MSKGLCLKYIMKNFQNSAWSRGIKFSAKVHDLNYFFWETSLKCNLSCRHCGSECGFDNSSKELPSEKVLQVFTNIAQSYSAKDIMVAVTGGEPLVRKDLFEVMTKVSDMGFLWGMVTNGMLVDEEVVEKCFKAGMKTVSVSVDGIGKTHNWLRNNELSYDRAINALKLFRDSNKFDVVEAITCVNAENINELEEMYNTFKDIGLQGWRMFTIFPKGRAIHQKQLLLNSQLIIRLFNFIKEKRSYKNAMYVSYSEEGYLGCEWEKEVRDDFFFCGAGINVGGLLADGSYSACPSLSRNWIQGNVHELSFSEAWENRYKKFRDRKWMRTDKCKKCSEWGKCNGSSLHLWDFEENRVKVCHLDLLRVE